MTDKNAETFDFDHAKNRNKPSNGMKIPHFFSKKGVHPYKELEWTSTNASITNEKNEVVFEQKNVEMPEAWNELATNVVVSKYFAGALNSSDRETSLKQVISRVANTITEWGVTDDYFATAADSERFRMELTSILVNQMAAFNSPVWFNVGVEDEPQCSACFINSVQDTMESILELAKTEGMLFKFGSGAGSNLSTIRSSQEGMSGGGIASGPVSFMKGYDAFAGVIKSGGKTRRAAKMVILNVDHPDIIDFIECKTREEKKAFALIKQGYESGLDGEAYSSIFFQNANHSIRVTNEFMHTVVQDGKWSTISISTGEQVETYKATELLGKISNAAWETGDPGLQFHTTINEWHTCPNTAEINASNPCSEYMFLDDSACNLSSLNLQKFLSEEGDFDVEAFRAAVRVMILAMEILVDNASYPTKKIAKNSHDFRPLGLGYTNLGALLMCKGLPYDSNTGRAFAGVITAIMHGEAYRTSAEIAGITGPFKGYARNRKPFLKVMRKHADSLDGIKTNLIPEYLMEEAQLVYKEMIALGLNNGFRNAQVTVLAPTGTISFMMDADTTGIEPDIALVKYKTLVGGGMLTIVNRTVEKALVKLGYEENQVRSILEYISEEETIEGAPGLKDEHLPIFDCALRPGKGVRSIHYMGHIRMMQAVQPFLSGAISKTVNLPKNVTVKDIHNVYLAAWQMGLKSIAVYRDGCKAYQPVNTSKEHETTVDTEVVVAAPRPKRIKLPDERQAITHKFTVGGYEGYFTVGMYENGQPGEIFIVMSKEGSVVSGLMDSFATAISMALQYGVPLKVLVKKFIHTRFEPYGYTNNSDIPIANSVMDYIFRWLALKFLPVEDQGIGDGSSEDKEDGSAKPNNDLSSDSSSESKGKSSTGSAKEKENGNGSAEEVVKEAKRLIEEAGTTKVPAVHDQVDSPPCPSCGAIMFRSGTCFTCRRCGSNTGCG
ncbi:MAG: vitamin B12-dependent ribonucleotide reductase [Candidatus Electryonea clarkiae]|nr:vitamin B12-dependent ribonucleotide reductase [Candidatus Electryonea clarkiae]MDP8285726.1 vitamin B12-dependent ribonucleotide reductase [Candidatus Electryonea clarkiae]